LGTTIPEFTRKFSLATVKLNIFGQSYLRHKRLTQGFFINSSFKIICGQTRVFERKFRGGFGKHLNRIDQFGWVHGITERQRNFGATRNNAVHAFLTKLLETATRAAPEMNPNRQTKRKGLGLNANPSRVQSEC
jgi:hypothetical protein